jgi:UDP-GlcNAc:undecaprenyl-phosphate/decaprenyl-phosphate GlcNAc-1-phosphate transferase
MTTYLLAFLSGLAASLALTPFVRDSAARRGWLDTPDRTRKLHRSPVPRIGGLAIYLSMVAAVAVACCLPTDLVGAVRAQVPRAAAVLGLGGLMMLIGLRDDVRALSPARKFAAQIAVATVAWLYGFRILGSWSAGGGIFELGILSFPITLVWIVGITNAFNLIDGIDGLSAGAALFAMLSMAVVSAIHEQQLTVLLLAALAGATLGFLRHNFIPASIFLGDSGSLLLGCMLAVLGIESSEKSSTAFAIAVPIVAFGLPVLDTAIAVIRRFASRKPIFTGDHGHIHHVLVERGVKPRNVVILLYGVCGLFGLFSLLFMNPSGRTPGLALATLGLCVGVGVQQLKYPELKELNRYLVRGIQHQRELIAENIAVGKMISGFQSADCLPGLLEHLAQALQEMEFSRVEVRLPGVSGGRRAIPAGNWNMGADGSHWLYEWSAADGAAVGPTRVLQNDRRPRRGRLTPGKDFRLEFVFLATGVGAPNPQATGALPGADVGRLTFYHPLDSQFPVSAICLLSRDIWGEFSSAINRIIGLQKASERRGA